jgi:hypothetical protein
VTSGYTLGSLDSTGGKVAAEEAHREATRAAAKAVPTGATAPPGTPLGSPGEQGSRPPLRVHDVELGRVPVGRHEAGGSTSSDPRGVGQAFGGRGSSSNGDKTDGGDAPPIAHDAALDAHVDVLRRRLMASPHPPSDGGADGQREGDGSGGGHPVIDRCNKLGTMSHRAFSLAFRLVFLAMPLAAGALNPVWGMAACVGVVGMLAVVDGAVEV